MRTMFVKPAKQDVKVRDPVSMQHLPAEGKEVPENSFWLRCLASGDIVKVESKSFVKQEK